MANDENTAVNDLIARVHGGPPSSSAVSAAPGPGSAGQAGYPMHTARPAQMPVAAPFDPPPGYPVVPRPLVPRPLMSPALPQHGPADPSMVAFGPAQLGSSGPTGSAGAGGAHGGPSGPWAATVPLNAPRPPRSRNQEHMVGTIRVSRRSERQVLFSKLVLPMALLVVVGMLVGGWVAIHGERSARTRTGSAAKPATEAAGDPATTATPEPAAVAVVAPTAVAPAAAPLPVTSPAAVVPPVTAPAVAIVPAAPAAQTTAPASALVDVRIDSAPRGATVTLVDHGKTQLVGNTPISAAFDPAREYDLVFTYPSKPTRVEHFNAGTTRRISVALDPAAPAVREPSPVEPVPGAAPPAPATVAPAPAHRTERAIAPAPAIAPAHRATPRAEAGDGTLMISTKPPCEIVIDGRSTGLTTPQKAISLPAGSHRITLINADKDIKKIVGVLIEAHETSKLIEDFLK